MKYIPADVSKKILIIGPDYQDHRGGIGAVLEVYNDFFEGFKFISTFRPYANNLKKVGYFFAGFFKFLVRLIKDKEIRIIHIHGSHGASIYRKFVIFFFSKYFFKKKVIYHIHSSSYDVVFKRSGRIKKKIITALVDNSDVIICLSLFWYQFFENNFNAKRIIIINNVVNAPVALVKTTQRQNKTVNFLFLGRIGNRKGIFDLLEILSEMKDAFRFKLKLKIGGDGDIDRLKEYIKNNRLEEIVEYAGWVADKQKASLFNETDVYVLPSYNEGLPISILEAMSYGLPVISTNVGGIPEVVEHNVNGFVFSPGDKNAMKNAIVTLLENPGMLIDFGKASLQKIEPYQPKYVAKQLAACYESLLTNGHE